MIIRYIDITPSEDKYSVRASVGSLVVDTLGMDPNLYTQRKLKRIGTAALFITGLITGSIVGLHQTAINDEDLAKCAAEYLDNTPTYAEAVEIVGVECNTSNADIDYDIANEALMIKLNELSAND